jgi:predicted RNA-binding Zn-ribbon protein involved in translation (DUF1610 family)
MSDPEISRRCLSCGASVRQRAAFCPQCGQLLVQNQPESQSDSQTNAVKGPETQIIAPPSESLDTQLIGAPAEAPETQIIGAPSESAETQIIAPPFQAPETQIIAFPSEIPPPAPGISDAGAMTQTDLVLPEEMRANSVPVVAETQPLITPTIQRHPTVNETDIITPTPPDGVQPGKEHNLLDRVDRIRRASSVVIDQAAYDPSLRFLLVAAVLFILFVLLMVLSKLIG